MSVQSLSRVFLAPPWQVPARVNAKLRARAAARRTKEVVAQLRSDNTEDFEWIDGILKSFHDRGGYSWELQDLKLFDLWRILKTELPERIVEFGAGSSSSVFARYAKMSKAQYLSCDQNANWSELACELAGVTEADENIEFRVCGVVEDRTPSPVEIKYDTELPPPYDLVFIDGPMLRLDGEFHANSINTNIFDMAAEQLPRLILVDIRVKTVAAILDRLGDRYEFIESQTHDLHRQEIEDDVRWFTVFRLKPEAQ